MRIASVEEVPDDACSGLGCALGYGNNRAARISEDGEICNARGRAQVRCAALDESSCNNFRASEFADLNMAKPMRACAARDRGFMQRQDTISPATEHRIIEGVRGLDIGGAKQIA
jgi:hypothetical protein